jgi:hypothetical protein
MLAADVQSMFAQLTAKQSKAAHPEITDHHRKTQRKAVLRKQPLARVLSVVTSASFRTVKMTL